jgi:hypothetical protein
MQVELHDVLWLLLSRDFNMHLFVAHSPIITDTVTLYKCITVQSNGGHLDCFLFGAFGNNAAVDITWYKLISPE